ncbi:MAG: hypothetical protein JJE52_00010 [Acidimicrobiia bacterium]|nr:hypothetical protein [Acidimicrobiia bacterium]
MPDPRGLTPTQRRSVSVAATDLETARVERAVVEEQQQAARADVARHERELTELVARRATARQVDAARSRLTTAATAQQRVTATAARIDLEIDDIRDVLDTIVDRLDDPFAALDGRLPVALLPIRIETRYVGTQLHVRIYPDVLHIDQLERLLTADEEAWGHSYWRERRHLTTADDLAALWDRLVAGRPAHRAAWIAEQTTPVNVSQIARQEPQFPTLALRPDGPSRAPVAQLLPGRWLILGYRGGTEVLRKWSGFVADPLPVGIDPGGAVPSTPTGPRPDVQDALAIDAAATWITDFEAAVAAGMGVKIGASDVKGGLGPRIDELVVLGVDHRRPPAEAAARFEEALQAHRFTSGLGFVGAGTATNAGDGDDVAARPAAATPGSSPTAATPTSAGALATRAFGLPADGALARVHAAADEVNPLTADLHTAVWEPTLGYFLRQIMDPIATDAQIDQVRDHFRRFVRPGGPLPLLRVGRQPYGVLPVVAPQRFAGTPTEMMLARAMRALRPVWAHAARSARQLGDSGDPAADLVVLLERTNRSGAFRIREATGPGVKANTTGLGHLHLFQQLVSQVILAALGVRGRPAIVDITLSDEEAVLPVPLVTGGSLSDTEGLASDFVRRIGGRLSSVGAVANLAKDASGASSLLEALLVHAATLELVRGTTGVVIRHRAIDMPIGRAIRDREIILVEEPWVGPTVHRAAARPMVPREPDIDLEVEIDGEGTAGAMLSLSPLQMAAAPLAGVSGRLSLADHLTAQTVAELGRTQESRQLGEFRSSLQRLIGAPTAELHRTTADALDALSHRFDSWATSLATRRLDTLRRTAPTGVHIGAFGWVEGLGKRASPASQGYVHGPSIAHATTAAILRSGHLARSEGAGDALAIDLSSRRTRDALKLLDGLRAGQSLGALLGYRFERRLRDRGAEYARYILPTRQRHPLAEGSNGRAGTEPVEAIAASNVVDGLRLAELDAAARAALLDQVGAAPGHRAGITAELDALADAVDAIGDLMVSESVFQAVVGNTDRAAAALDALDRQTAIPDVSVARTPRTGTGLSHRLLVSLDRDRPPTTWNGLVDHRSRAEPRVSAWVARLLGDPAAFRLAADVVDAEGGVLETVTVTLRDLRMSALSVVLSAAHGSQEVSQLEERLARVLAAAATNPAAAGLRAHEGTPIGAPPGSVGLAELMVACRRIADLLSSARPAIGRDLVPGTDPVVAPVDAVELGRRADALRDVLAAVAATDPDSPALTVAAIDKVLRSAADLGMRGAHPQSADRDILRVQLAEVVEQAAAHLAQLDAIATRAATAHGPTPSAEAQAALHTERIQHVLGPDFPVVPRMVMPPALASMLTASATDPALLSGEPLAPTEWLMRHSMVRPSVERLWAVLTDAERRGAEVDATQLAVAQVPHRPGERWIGLPASSPATQPMATTSLLFHRAGDSGDPTTTIANPMAALLVDQWHERVPNPVETTGLAFNFDRPGARRPQSIVLAVPPEADAAHWTVDALVDTVREAIDLTRIRTVDLDDLPGIGRILPALYFAFNVENEVPSVNVRRLVETSLATWMKEMR